MPQAERDRVGEIIFRFFFGCLYRHHQFSGDPHPGNYVLLDDGRVAFLDFGLYKRMPAGAVELELACQRAAIEGNGDLLKELFVALGLHPRPRPLRPPAPGRPLPGRDRLVHDRRRPRSSSPSSPPR